MGSSADHPVFQKVLAQMNNRQNRGRHIGAMIGMTVGTNGMNAKVLVNDFHVKRVGGAPPYTLLLAVRHGFGRKDAAPDLSMILLLRVCGRAAVPQDVEREKILDQYHKAKPHANGLWDKGSGVISENDPDHPESADPFTQSELQFGGLDCDILGTFYPSDLDGLRFSSDVEYSVNACMYDVIRPTGDLLNDMFEVIRRSTEAKNKRREDFGLKDTDGGLMTLGTVRYSATQFLQPATDNECPVYLDPMELIGNRTGVFGMSRSGKSNLIKILMTTMHTAYQDGSSRMGQLVFDVNGEYANTNKQDGGSVAETLAQEVVCLKAGVGGNDKFKEYLPNFYYDIDLGFRMLRKVLGEQDAGGSSESFKVLMSISIPEPKTGESPSTLTWDGLLRRLAFRALLHHTGFAFVYPKSKEEVGPENEDIYRWVASDTQHDTPRERAAREIIEHFSTTYKSARKPPHEIFEEHFKDVFRIFRDFRPHHPKDVNSLDKGTLAIIALLTGFSESTGRNISGSGYFTMAHAQHSAHGSRPFQMVSRCLEEGKLVIIDLSGSTPSARAGFMEEQASFIFNEYNARFINNEERRALLIYIEEAHNMLGVSAKADDVWPRIAKEGAKMNIGLVFATQEPSSIQPNILKNTDNFIALHMNNSAEANFMGGYGFGRFVDHIQRVTDVGYIRIKHKNIPFAYPCQIRKFDVNDPNLVAYREARKLGMPGQTSVAAAPPSSQAVRGIQAPVNQAVAPSSSPGRSETPQPAGPAPKPTPGGPPAGNTHPATTAPGATTHTSSGPAPGSRFSRTPVVNKPTDTGAN